MKIHHPVIPPGGGGFGTDSLRLPACLGSHGQMLPLVFDRALGWIRLEAFACPRNVGLCWADPEKED